MHLLILLFALLVAPNFAQVLQSARMRYNFNSDWRVFVGDKPGAQSSNLDDSAWRPVSLPYAWNEDDAFRRDIANLSTGIAWYRKHFRLPTSARQKKVFLEFEGIRHAGEFYLNGKSIGRSENGITAFGFDISESIIEGQNTLAARIDNSWNYKEKDTGAGFQWNDKNFYANYGGLNKNVYLHVTDKLHQTLPIFSSLNTTGVYIYARDFDIKGKSAEITAQTEVRNEYGAPKTFEYQVTIKDSKGNSVNIIDGGKYVLQPNETKIIKASSAIPNLEFWSWGYGYLYDVFTTLNVDGNPIDIVKTRTGFRKPEFKSGMFRLNDRVLHLKGYAQRTTNEWPALGSAVPPWLSDYSNRLMVESNANLVRWMHVTPWKQDIESCDRVGLMQAMPAGDSEKDVTDRRWKQRVDVMRDAIIYNRNNPSIMFYESGNKGISEEHMLQMKALRDTYDPYGGRAIGAREMLDSKVAEYGGEMLYINKGSRKPMWAMEYSRDEGLRKYWDNYSPPFHRDGEGPPYKNDNISQYNHNQDSHAVEDVVRWFDYWEARPGTGKRVNAGGVNIIFSDSNTHHRGSENYRTSGEVDAVRLPKDAYFAHKVIWDGWVDGEKFGIYILGHWNYEKGTKKSVRVVSSAKKVELVLNGKSLGFGKQSSRFLFTFDAVEWVPGELKAVGYDGRGRVVTESTRQTSGDPSSLRLTPHLSPSGLLANGNDIAMVDVEVVDAQGNRCPTALNTIQFTLSGEASWRGGIAQGPQNYILSKQLPVENGINRVLLRSNTKAGKITLVAMSGNLLPASIELESKPSSTIDGLSRVVPSEDLPSNIKRGPTPAGESFKLQRQTLNIATASAGSNQSSAKLSFDDDETTSWSSDSGAEESWIQYELAQAADVNQIVIKVVGHRTKSYAMKVSLDTVAVWKGQAGRNLGYTTIRFNKRRGKSVRIEGDGGGKLGIVEVEIYGPLS